MQTPPTAGRSLHLCMPSGSPLTSVLTGPCLAHRTVHPRPAPGRSDKGSGGADPDRAGGIEQPGSSRRP
jgi:hypothetical protein